jgi:hypothetical protein
MITLLTIVALLIVVALAAPRYGADSHTSDGWTAHPGDPVPRTRPSVRGDLLTLGAGLRTALRAPLGRGTRETHATSATTATCRS